MTWLVEQGIGEERAIEIVAGQVEAARISWPGELSAGQVEDAILVARPKGNARGLARFASGEEALVDKLPRDAQEGAPIRLIVTRAKLSEKGRTKLAQARPTDAAPCPAPSLLESLTTSGQNVQAVRRFPDGAWQEIWSEACEGIVDFNGGSLHFSTTPAMVLIDVDGTLPPRELALAAVQPLSKAIRRFDLSGSIGVDFPTLQTKADRQAVDRALSEALSDWPHERTAMNGFGFVQIVSKLERPSLLHRLAHDRVGAAARLILRQAEGIEDPGMLVLTLHPLVHAAIRPEWKEELKRRTARRIRWREDRTLAIEAGFAQAVIE